MQKWFHFLLLFSIFGVSSLSHTGAVTRRGCGPTNGGFHGFSHSLHRNFYGTHGEGRKKIEDKGQNIAKGNDRRIQPLSLLFLAPHWPSRVQSHQCFADSGDGTADEGKKVVFPFDRDAPLQDAPVPPWIVKFVGGNEPEEDYVPRHYTEEEIQTEIAKYNKESRERTVLSEVKEIECVKLKSYGLKFKQIQPVRYHNGKAFTFFYVHSLHTDVIPVLMNSLRRVAKRHIGAGRITALRVPGLEHEFLSIVGLREDFFQLSRNLRGIIFRNVPETATFTNPIIARLRIKGPLIAVAGHLKIEQEEPTDIGSSSGSFTDRKIEIVNKNHYICTLSPNSYLTMDVKIEYIANYVVPEHGPESLERDITDDGFIHFCSSCNPISVFAFRGERRGLDEQTTSEIVTLELHTDGSTTPRLGLLKTNAFLLEWFERTLVALRTDCKPDYASIADDRDYNTRVEMMHPELNRHLPWNPYIQPQDRAAARQRWFYRQDVRRQYAIDPESRMAKEEQLAAWKKDLEDQIAFEEQLPPALDDGMEAPETILERRNREQEEKDESPPSWLFKDPAGPGNIGQWPIFEFDRNSPKAFDYPRGGP
ncbi:DNA-directed RNA polymerase, alpha subunit, N terminal domain containing protein [Theileria equi strain WA]|uniref:DNA-directed RNA polymerase, alpha subunit, N terminal domain containing protein n=1 Tax=Theileria equi strain WA TaxID=1537102 RepID=L1LBA7_THEEQ|nr:DNA-directed RNA polymerase, alpha subunit, N terminal domain containing protein [Theileria equi strain WA]EKX72555.1 DNA-directed RNA polymerase, alpha subunit, N terminal domain containing protein [Theileria equi strain WA]|eukprot:XP_004832007.1 DNA-directed RNA polymerase, alpha subunit, N terminal domain containing protein [Theileria equi strain WA]